jgi:hypothetical protein
LAAWSAHARRIWPGRLLALIGCAPLESGAAHDRPSEFGWPGPEILSFRREHNDSSSAFPTARLLTPFDFLPGDGLACRLSLLLTQRSVLFHGAPHLDLKPVHLVPDVVHLTVETVVQPEVSLLAVAAAPDVTCYCCSRSSVVRLLNRIRLALISAAIITTKQDHALDHAPLVRPLQLTLS